MSARSAFLLQAPLSASSLLATCLFWIRRFRDHSCSGPSLGSHPKPFCTDREHPLHLFGDMVYTFHALGGWHFGGSSRGRVLLRSVPLRPGSKRSWGSGPCLDRKPGKIALHLSQGSDSHKVPIGKCRPWRGVVDPEDAVPLDHLLRDELPAPVALRLLFW